MVWVFSLLAHFLCPRAVSTPETLVNGNVANSVLVSTNDFGGTDVASRSPDRRLGDEACDRSSVCVGPAHVGVSVQGTAGCNTGH